MAPRSVFLLLLGLGACRGHPDALMDVPVASASLQDVSLTTVAVIGGPVTGSGTLVVTEPGGVVRAFPVELRGSTLGAVLEVDVDGPGHDNRAEFVLPAPVVTGNDLLGRYRGSSVSLDLVLGFDSVHLKNKRDVMLDKNYFSIGVGLHAGFEWLRIDVAGAELTQDTADPWEPRRSGGCNCTVPPPVVDDTSDTGPPDTADSAGTSPTADTDSPTTTPGTPVDTDAPASTAEGSGGSSCDEGCASAPVPVPWWTLLLVPWLARRRH